MKRPVSLLAALCALAFAADYPEAEISNGLIRAKLHLPDAHSGYYQATRFDWSGQMPFSKYKGHTYFGLWNPAGPTAPNCTTPSWGPSKSF